VIQKIFHGEYSNSKFDDSHLSDLNGRELAYFGAMILGLVWMGMYPQSFLDLSATALQGLLAGTQELISTVVQN
jgi:NADH-quinone oxidoreductase subunit M